MVVVRDAKKQDTTTRKILNFALSFKNQLAHKNHRSVKCPQCPHLSLSSKAELAQHISEEHDDSKPHKCAYCETSYKTRNELDSHYETDHPFRCHLCCFEFKTKSSYETHLEAHDDNVYFCDICSQEFKNQDSLTDHMEQHALEPLLLCEICSKLFKTKRGLNRHLKIHKGEQERSVCDICGVSVLKEHMKQHKRIHGENRPNKSKPREKKHKCIICGDVFFQKNHLDRHLMMHTGEKPFKCEVCHKESIQKCNLRRHKCRPQL